MKFEIEISEADAKFLTKWCSVKRTLNTAYRMSDELAARLEGDENFKILWNEADMCCDELKDLAPVLDRLHSTVREAIWKKELGK